MFVCGDFKSKLGLITPEDEETGLSCCLGAHDKGICNSSGDALIQFLLHHGWFASNTAFEHASCHKTSWTGWLNNQNAPVCSTVTEPVYSQTVYVLCKTSTKSLLNDARSYGGATLSSDHKPVVATCNLANFPLMQRPKSKKSKVLHDLHRLTSDSSLQEAYCKDLNDHASRLQPSNDQNKALADMLGSVRKSAEATIGTIPTNRTTRYCQDNFVADLPQHLRQLRLCNETCNHANLQKELHNLCMCMLKQINHRNWLVRGLTSWLERSLQLMTARKCSRQFRPSNLPNIPHHWPFTPGWQIYRNRSGQSWCHSRMVSKAVFWSTWWMTGPIHWQSTSTQSINQSQLLKL